METSTHFPLSEIQVLPICKEVHAVFFNVNGIQEH